MGLRSYRTSPLMLFIELTCPPHSVALLPDAWRLPAATPLACLCSDGDVVPHRQPQPLVLQAGTFVGRAAWDADNMPSMFWPAAGSVQAGLPTCRPSHAVALVHVLNKLGKGN